MKKVLLTFLILSSIHTSNVFAWLDSKNFSLLEHKKALNFVLEGGNLRNLAILKELEAVFSLNQDREKELILNSRTNQKNNSKPLLSVIEIICSTKFTEIEPTSAAVGCLLYAIINNKITFVEKYSELYTTENLLKALNYATQLQEKRFDRSKIISMLESNKKMVVLLKIEKIKKMLAEAKSTGKYSDIEIQELENNINNILEMNENY